MEKVNMTEQSFKIKKEKLVWKKITSDNNLDLDYTRLFSKDVADYFFQELDNSIEYFTGDLAKVRVFGKIHPIPRQQVAFGNEGITYKFSGLTVPALPWPPIIQQLKNIIFDATGYSFDFVLVNRYRNGMDHMGEHRDNEPELDHTSPIASLTFGQTRTFTLRHKDARKSGKEKIPIPPIKIELEHGSLLMMNPPTNEIWYHAIPPRKNAVGVRINLTFRKHNK